MRFSFLSLLLIFIFSLRGQAVVVSLYDFEDQDMDSNDLDLLSISTTMTIGSGIPGSLSGNTGQGVAGLEINNEHTDAEAFGGSDSSVLGTPLSGFALVGRYADIDKGTTLQTAIENNIYLSFTLTPGSGQQIDLTSFSLDLDITGGGADKYVGLFSETTGFTSASQALGGTIIYDPSDANGDQPGERDGVNLASLSLDPITTSTEFRVYIMTNAGTSSHGVALDNITLEGDISAIPEPTSSILLGLGIFGLLLTRRNR